VDDGEAEAAAAREAAVERLEQAVEFGRRDTHSFVGDRHDDVLRPRLGGGGQAQPAAGRHRADAVAGEIPDNLLDLALVGLVPQLLVRDVDFDHMMVVDVGAVAQQRRCVAQRAPQVETDGGHTLRPGVGEK